MQMLKEVKMKQYFDLKGRVAIVTGCSGGLGVQMAKALANQGAIIVPIARRQQKIEEVAAEIHEEFGVETFHVRCDITDTQMVEEVIDKVLEKYGITVNAICPGYFHTPLTKETLDSDFFQQNAKTMIPEERYGNEGELDTAAIFLASPASGYVTGVNLPVDGGYTCM
jgi:NAD(P)-dependent dehydrogenase (short-subunit alcohol dehydrogenase family)